MIHEPVAQRQQAVCEMDVFHDDTGIFLFQLHIGKIPKSFYTVTCQQIHILLCHITRNGQNSHIRLTFYNIVFQCLHGVDCDAVDFPADQQWIDIKGCIQNKTAFAEIKVLNQSLPQITGADDDQFVIMVYAQDRTDFGTEDFHIIAVALLAEFAETAQILADLRSGNAHFASQRTGGNTDHIVVVQIV